MQHKSRFFRGAIAGAALTMSMMVQAYNTPVDVPALTSKYADVSPLMGVAKAGKRIVAVGLRGHIVYSDDEGKHWIQAPVPVSSDLVAVSFVDDKNGWAVGHYGVVLHSADGGASWTKQLDGKAAADITARYYAAKSATDHSPEVERATRQAKAQVDEANAQSMLDVAFENDHQGYIVGAFNRIFRTEDGGKSWTPLMDRTDNSKELHFYAVHTDGKATYLAGEQGMIWRLDKAKNHFDAIQTPYNGTLFGIIVDDGTLLVYGMRGSLFRSGDEGKTWERIQTGNQAGISAGAVLPDGKIAIVNMAGSVMRSSDHGMTFQPAKTTAKPMSYYGIKPIANGQVVFVGSEGVRVDSLQ